MNNKLLSLAIILIIGQAQVSCEQSYGYIQNFWDQDKIDSIKTSIGENFYSTQNVEDLINHNLGTLNKNPEDNLSQDFIQKFGKQNIFDPIYLNYIFIVESKNLIQGNQNTFNSSGIPIKVNTCNKTDLSKQNCILNRLFDKTNNNSLVNKLKQLYGDDEHRNFAYIYATKPNVSQFKDYILNLDYLKNGEIQISESITGSKLKIPGTLQECANQVSSEKFYFDLKNNKIYNNQNISVAINEKNRENIIDFMKDICSMNQLSKMIKKEQQPDILSFHISSINQLENVLSQDDMNVIYQIWNQSYNQFIKNVQKNFKNSEIAGQMLFVENKDQNDKQVQSHKFTQINQQKKATTSRRMLLTSTQTISNCSKPDQQIFIWFFLFIAFVLFFAVLALLQMDFERDSLLYAKFIATDYK